MAKKPIGSGESTKNDDDFFSGSKWTPIEVPKKNSTTVKTTEEYDSLVEDETPVKPSAPFKPKAAPPAPEVDEDEDDDFEFEEELEEEDEVEDELDEAEAEETEVAQATLEETPKRRKDIEDRFKEYTKKLKDKDQEIYERDLAYAQMQLALENQQREYEAKLRNLSSSYTETIVQSAESAVAAARARLKQAKELGDTDAEMEATEELADAKARVLKAKDIAATIPQREDGNYQPLTREQQYAKQRGMVWIQQNQGVVADSLVQQAIQHVDAKLASEGFLPHQGKYLDELTNRVNRILERNGRASKVVNPFKQEEYNFNLDDNEELANMVRKPSAPTPKPKNPLGGSAGAPAAKKRKVLARLDEGEINQANRFGISPEVLLKQKAFREQYKDVKGFKPIYVPRKSK